MKTFVRAFFNLLIKLKYNEIFCSNLVFVFSTESLIYIYILLIKFKKSCFQTWLDISQLLKNIHRNNLNLLILLCLRLKRECQNSDSRVNKIASFICPLPTGWEGELRGNGAHQKMILGKIFWYFTKFKMSSMFYHNECNIHLPWPKWFFSFADQNQ